jgi:hypothetical protein
VSRLPTYALVGLFVMVLSEVAMLRRAEPFWTWHTPIAWSGYVLFVDGLVSARRGQSWLTSGRGEFAFLAAVSIPLWLVFEFYNLFIQNWRYVGLPPPPWRWLGYAWSFATIWPAIFETGELVACVRASDGLRGLLLATPPGDPPRTAPPTPSAGTRVPSGRDHRRQRARPLSKLEWTMILIGAVCVIWPIVWPSRYLAAPVWLGFIFLLDPINRRLGADSLFAEAAAGSRDRLINLLLAGLICGVLWEFWNYWAGAKWVYEVPILPQYRLFEMPLVGYLGFPAFALECFTMYVFVRHWLWRGPGRPISL